MTAPLSSSVPSDRVPQQNADQKPPRKSRVAEIGQRTMQVAGTAAKQAGDTTFKAAVASGKFLAILTAILAVILAIFAGFMKLAI
jgi:hypothetical protein